MSEATPVPNQILCPRCKSLLTFPSISMGSMEQCPHCNKWFVVSESMILPESASIGGVDEGYALKINTPVESPREDLLSDANMPETEAADEASEDEIPTWRPIQALPLELFLKGTFTFPFSIKSRGSLIVLMILCFAMFTMVYSALADSGRTDSLSQSFGRLSIYISFVLGIFLMVVFAAFGISILCDTSEGFERFVSMRPDWSIAWIEEPGYILVNIFWGSLPASILLLILPDIPKIKIPVYALSEIILFPIFLLSALVGRSCMTPYSGPVWRSLRYSWQAWALFYLFTLLVGEAMVFFWRLIPFECFWTNVIILSIFIPVFWMVYFRLLGRLALFCSGRYDEIHPPKNNRDINPPEENDLSVGKEGR